MWDDIPDGIQSKTSSISSSVVQISTLPNFLDWWRSITFNRFVLSLVKGYHLQLQKWPPLFSNFKRFSIKAAAAHCPVIQEEVQEHIAKRAIEPFSHGAGFYSNSFVVPKHMGGL